ncbi:hypothetical protein BP5796_01223 [Coleophoma crateriformis]|uniref:Uncharacterized protein n=1 Tax=Coleophoma crateriformis TaxID=565419 RepID=A0A3D8T008_9HELO|nr:hypothetical protein BP5796_01223 [Coleophoma crateriformis]
MKPADFMTPANIVKLDVKVPFDTFVQFYQENSELSSKVSKVSKNLKAWTSERERQLQQQQKVEAWPAEEETRKAELHARKEELRAIAEEQKAEMEELGAKLAERRGAHKSNLKERQEARRAKEANST